MKRTAAILLFFSLLSATPAGAVMCPALYRPVCALGSDGQRAQFDNACRAEAKGARMLHEGSCEAPGSGPMRCPRLYTPTCAADPSGTQRTYPNMCAAEAANASLIHDRACAAGVRR